MVCWILCARMAWATAPSCRIAPSVWGQGPRISMLHPTQQPWCHSGSTQDDSICAEFTKQTASETNQILDLIRRETHPPIRHCFCRSVLLCWSSEYLLNISEYLLDWSGYLMTLPALKNTAVHKADLIGCGQVALILPSESCWTCASGPRQLHTLKMEHVSVMYKWPHLCIVSTPYNGHCGPCQIDRSTPSIQLHWPWPWHCGFQLIRVWCYTDHYHDGHKLLPGCCTRDSQIRHKAVLNSKRSSWNGFMRWCWSHSLIFKFRV